MAREDLRERIDKQTKKLESQVEAFLRRDDLNGEFFSKEAKEEALRLHSLSLLVSRYMKEYNNLHPYAPYSLNKSTEDRIKKLGEKLRDIGYIF